jgi:molybdopterin-guanine dinucleotide biosynthesis protein B
MRVVGFAGYSGAGKTTLVTALVARLRATGVRVSVIKHAHHQFDIDQPGKDSHRHREAGAFEVLIASDRRLAKMREYELPAEPSVHQLLLELHDCDWVLVEGFKHADIPKLEVWRSANGKPVLYPHDAFVVAVCADAASTLPEPTGLPRLDLDDPDAVLAFLLSDPARYDHANPLLVAPAVDEPGHGAGATAGGHADAD